MGSRAPTALAMKYFPEKEAQSRYDPEAEGGFEDTGGGIDTGVLVNALSTTE